MALSFGQYRRAMLLLMIATGSSSRLPLSLKFLPSFVPQSLKVIWPDLSVLMIAGLPLMVNVAPPENPRTGGLRGGTAVTPGKAVNSLNNCRYKA